MLVDEALDDLIEKRKLGRPRANVMAAYQASHEKFGTLYKRSWLNDGLSVSAVSLTRCEFLLGYQIFVSSMIPDFA